MHPEKHNKKSACIAIPTYNEKENIEVLVNWLFKIFTQTPEWDMSILIIDDHSPDNTAEIVKNLQKHHHNIYLLEGEKKGLGEAYTRGFEYILKNINPDYIFEMDADLQHNPEDIPRFLKKAEEGYEFIIGSRYAPGGDYPNWSFKRKLYSWGANLLARLIAGIKGIEDCTSGYRCIKASFLKSFDLRSLKTNGYAFQLSLLHAAVRRKLKIAEIPILFPNRRKGSSKLGHKDIREFFFHAFRLRFKRYRWYND